MWQHKQTGGRVQVVALFAEGNKLKASVRSLASRRGAWEVFAFNLHRHYEQVEVRP